MASLYDGILVNGVLRPRLNKQWVKFESVPPEVKAVLTENNVVDENGIVIVEQKNEEAKKPSEENENELKGGKLARIDGDKDKAEDSSDADESAEESEDDTNIDESDVEEDLSDDESEDSEDDEPETTTKKDSAAPESTTDLDDDDPEEDPVEEAEKPVRAKRTRAARTTATKRENIATERFRSKVPQSAAGMGFPRKNGKTVDIFDLVTPHTKVKLVGGHTVPLSEESFRERTEGQIIARLKELGFELVDFADLERQQAVAGVADPSVLLDEEDEEEILVR